MGRPHDAIQLRKAGHDQMKSQLRPRHAEAVSGTSQDGIDAGRHRQINAPAISTDLTRIGDFLFRPFPMNYPRITCRGFFGSGADWFPNGDRSVRRVHFCLPAHWFRSVPQKEPNGNRSVTRIQQATSARKCATVYYTVNTRCDMEQEKITVTVRVPGDLKRAFEAAAADNDRTASQLLRDFMREYVRKNAQGDLLKGAR